MDGRAARSKPLEPPAGPGGRVARLLHSRALWVTLLTGVYLMGIATRAVPALFGPEGWRWPSRAPSPSTLPRWWPALLLLTGYLLLFLWLDGRGADTPSRRREWAVLLFLALMAPALQIALKYIHYRYLAEFYLYRTIGPHNGFWQIAIGAHDLAAFLRSYPQQMQDQPFLRIHTHPPGGFLWVWLWWQGFERLPALAHAIARLLRPYNCADLWFVSLTDGQVAATLGQMTLPLFSGLTVFPLYLLGKRLDGPRTGFRAAAFYVLLPSLTLFTMRWDQLYPLFLLLALCALHRGLTRHRLGGYLAAGLIVSLASFMSFGNLTILPALAVYGLGHWLACGRRERRRWLRRTAPGWALLLLGALTVWLAYQATCGVSFWDVFSTAMRTHIHGERPYWVWLAWNLWDFLAFLGIPLAVLFLLESGRAWREVLKKEPAVRLEHLPALVASAVVLALAVTDLAPEEVGRIWLLWMALACLAVAVGLGRQRALTVLVVTLLAGQTFFFTLFFRVSQTGMPSYVPRQAEMTPPAIDRPLPAHFGSEITLLGYDLAPAVTEPGQTIRLTLYWQAVREPQRPYTVFTHLLDARGEMRGQQDNMPQQGQLPTTCWQSGEFVTDVYDIPLAEDAPPGEYTVEVGMYYLPTGERLPVSGVPGQPPDRLLLGPITVVAPGGAAAPP